MSGNKRGWVLHDQKGKGPPAGGEGSACRVSGRQEWSTCRVSATEGKHGREDDLP